MTMGRNKRNSEVFREEPPYKAYRITTPGHETKIVFAAGIWSAVGALLQWRSANGIGEVGFTLDPEWARSLEGVAREHIYEARSHCDEPRIGARYRADVGWGLRHPGLKEQPPD
jgi:hypothetical protein